MKKNIRSFDIICYTVILVLALLFLYIGNRVAVRGLTVFSPDEQLETVEAVIQSIVQVAEVDSVWGGDTQKDREITFLARISTGEQGETVTAVQNTGGYYFSSAREVAVGDKVLLSAYEPGEWVFIDYVRIDKILVLAGVFVILLLLFGRIEGFNAILSLCLTCTAIFAVFIPAILSGKNIYLYSVVVCAYSTVTTLLIVIGVNRKSLAAISGCLGGIMLIGLLTLFMNQILGLTGLVSEESVYLLYLETEQPVDLRAIIFAGIIIGAVGAVMDVAMSIASALWEIKTQTSTTTVLGFFQSGVRIGRDVMGTMVNTLILAYIGNSLSVVLLLTVYANSFVELINREMVIVELLQAVAGSLGILLTMPLTALVCAFLYGQRQRMPAGSS